MHRQREDAVTMTRQEFLGRLRDVRDQFDWQLTNGSGPGLQIRAVPRKAPEKLLDPMGALCYAELDTEISPADWSRAGELLGLAAPGELAAAANDRTWAGRGANREPIVYLQNLRRRLEAAVGLGGNGVSDPPQKPHAFERFRMTDLRSVARSPRES